MLRASLLVLALGAGDFLPGRSAPTDWRVDAAQSRLTVKVLPAGLLASTLHTHFFQPENWSGEIARDPIIRTAVRVEVRIAADSLRDHQPKLSAKDIAKVEQSDFGIKPYATALGTIAVRDEITIEIALVEVPRR